MELTSSRWARNGDVRLHYIDNDPAEPVGLPVVLSPGYIDFASEYEHLLEFFHPRRFVAVELRGRGLSDAPPSGYTAADHLADLEAIVEHTGIGRFHLMTFSRGTTWGLDFAIRHPDRIATISIGDYQAVEHRVEPEMAELVLTQRFRGRPNTERFLPHVPREIFAASRARDLHDDLGAIGRPVLVAVGTESGRMVTSDDMEEYRRRVPGVEFVTIEGAAHDLFRGDRFAYARAVTDLIARNPLLDS